LLIEIRIGSSADLLQSYDRRELDTVIVRLRAGRNDGEILTEEKFCWLAEPGWQHRADEPLPLATMAEPCGRACAGREASRCGGRALSYNIKKVISILGADGLMEAIRA
jgi:DNA-binding transcriptional LysR family regulator